jgi:predicted DNA-binding transcriptional regulator AlpA
MMPKRNNNETTKSTASPPTAKPTRYHLTNRIDTLDTSSGDPRDLLKTPEVDTYCGVSEKTVKKWRSEGKGPPWRKYGQWVRCLRSDLWAWVDTLKRA